jgi:WD domain, G-beta repeat
MQDESTASLQDDQALVREIVARLSEEEAARCRELGIFPANVRVPTGLVAALWRIRGGLSAAAARRLLQRLAELSADVDSGQAAPTVAVERGGMTLSRTACTFFRRSLSRDDVAAASGALVDAATRELAGAENADPVPWWNLDRRNDYLWEHLVRHLVDAGREEQATALLEDPRWGVARVRRSGLESLANDLAELRADRPPGLWSALGEVMDAEGHDPTGDRAAAELIGLLSSTEEGRTKVSALQESIGLPLLIDRWPAPDPDDTERGAKGRLLAAAPDGAWFATVATVGGERIVRIWDTATGNPRVVRISPGNSILALAPDRSWLATGHKDATIRIWDLATGECPHELTGHTDPLWNAEVAPDGSWLVTADSGGVLRVWDTATWTCLRVLPGPGEIVERITMSRNGRFLFVPHQGPGKATITHVWDTATWTSPHVLAGPDGWGSLQVVPSADGRRVVIRAVHGRTAQVWSSLTGHLQRTVRMPDRHGGKMTLSPDGEELVIIFGDRRVRIFDAAGTRKPRVLTRFDEPVSAVEVSPDGRWLATAGKRTLRVWEISTGACVTVLRTDEPPTECTWLPGGLLAVSGPGGTGLYELRLP